MKLKPYFISRKIDDAQFLVGVGKASFNGIVRGNDTAAAIIDRLKQETTEQAVVDSLLAEYDVSRDVAERDVRTVLDTLRSIDALEE